MISYGVYQLFNLIMFFMLIKVLLSWFPNIDWYKEPFNSLKRFTDIFFLPFRKIIPPVGMIDFSPIAAFFGFKYFAKCNLQSFGKFRALEIFSLSFCSDIYCKMLFKMRVLILLFLLAY